MDKRHTDCFKILRTGKTLFFGGLAVMVFALLLPKGSTGFVGMAVGLAGVAACFGGLIYAAVMLRCPDCGKSLMLGGRMPAGLPAFCPHCGKKLEEISGD